MNKEELITIYTQAYEFSVEPYEPIPEVLTKRLSDLSVWLATTSSMLGDAQKLWDERKEFAYGGLGDDYRGNELKDRVDIACREEKALTRKIERLNAALVHCIDATRSQLSFVKEDFKTSNII